MAFRIAPHLIQQHGLAHTAQPHHHDALCRPAKLDPLQPYFDISFNDGATGQFGLRAPGAGSIGVSKRIHDGDYSEVSKVSIKR